MTNASKKTSSLSNGSDDGSQVNWLDDWGFTLDHLFKISTKFFKDNEGKVLHPSYNERNHYLALVLQANHGPFDESKASPLGALDIVGRDRRQAWADLRDISKDKAMSTFINLLNSSCPSFKPYIEAHKREKEEREKIKKKEEEETRLRKEKEELEEEEKMKEEEFRRKNDEEFSLQEEQRRAIKEALNKQTYGQFKQYAEQQYPNDLEQQNILISKLQDQHYEQYMQQIVQHRLISGMNGKSSSTAATAMSSTTKSPEESPESPLLRKDDSHVSYKSTLNPTPTSMQQTITSSTSAYPTNPGENRKYSTDNSQMSKSNFQEVSGDMPIAGKLEDIPVDAGDQANDGVGGVGEFRNGAATAAGEEEDESGEEDFDVIEAPHMWTNKEIKTFKESIKQINGDGIIKVGHGEIVTVRVPTHPDGTCIFWEFATDSYDIGFGLFFEWTKNPGNQVSVHISESEDEDDEDEDEMIGPSIGGSIPSDPEKGSHKCIQSSDELPSSVIVPIYRRDCHEEVYAGSHPYPGKGVYLLKFDNSYSLWRSKTLYYRVYYTK